MKKRTLFRSGAAFLMGLLMTAAVGCFTSFAYDSARLKACSVENGNSISVTGTATTGALNEGETPDDGYYYLFELHPYESEIGSRTDYIAWSNKSDKLKFTLKYSGDSTDTMLYSRFVVALKTGSTYTPISNAIYVDPELRFILCNTTEAGIRYDAECKFEDKPGESYPAKLTQFMYHRFETFGKEEGKGFIILSCELIDDNGKELEKCVLKYAKQWNLGEEFITWIQKENVFCSTLVDRIVTGYPRNEASAICEELGYEDNVLDTGEIFGFWVIEGPQSIKKEFPIEEAGLPILITDNHKPYKQRKVRILNGAHTSFVLGAYLAGKDIVRDCMNDEVICRFMNKTIYDEIIPTLDLPKEELIDFASAVTERFKNPFIDHALLAISLNSTSKWKARVMPSLKEYVKRKGTLPKCITASFAFYIAFFSGHTLTEEGLIAEREGNTYTVKDDREVLQFYYEHREDSTEKMVHAVCKNTEFWGEDLTEIEGFESAVCGYLDQIRKEGSYSVMKSLISLD